MVSAEPWTVPGCGSLNFLATGEICDGDTIHDRQQQHDPNGIWATTLAYGQNHATENTPLGILDATAAAGLIESSITVSDRHTMFSRSEIVEMPAHHLHAHEYGTAVFAVGKVQLGYVRHLPARKGVRPGIGGAMLISLVPPQLAPRYSGSIVPGFTVFLNFQPARHRM